MMLLAGLLALQAKGPIRVELGIRDEAVFCVAAPLPRLGSRDRELLAVAMEALTQGSQVYPPALVTTLTEGRGIQTSLAPDEALVTIAVPAASAKAGTDLIASLIKEPSFLQEDLDSSLGRLKGKADGFWPAAMDEPGNVPSEAPHDQVMSVFQRVFRPDRVVMAYGGAKDSDVAEEWSLRTSDWSVPPAPRYPDYDLAPAPASAPGTVTVCQLVGPSFAPDEPTLPARLLSLYALGVGKDSSLFRICRQRHAWSYRQEGYLCPSASGWEPRLLVPMIATPEAESRMQSLQKELLADADSWTDDDRARALGMAEANLLRGLPYGPLLLGDDPLDRSPEDQVTMAAYWQVKTGTAWDPQVLYQAMAKIDLAGLKAAAHGLLDQARILVLPAGG